MEILGWLNIHCFDLLQTASILVGLFATLHTIQANTKERKIDNLFAVTSAHRELWTQFYRQPSLHRVLERNLDLEAAPLTLAEKRFVHELILHLRTSFKARQAGMDFDDDAVAADIHQFFSRPIPRAVWDFSRAYQDPKFVLFVEANFEPAP
jgi:hypothetical protein